MSLLFVYTYREDSLLSLLKECEPFFFFSSCVSWSLWWISRCVVDDGVGLSPFFCCFVSSLAYVCVMVLEMQWKRERTE